MDDGSQRVDWENLESIMIVLSHNVQRFCERTYGRFRPIWDVPFAGVPTNSFRSKAPFRIEDDEDGDSGIWEAMHIITPATAKNSPQVQRVDSLLNNSGSSLEDQDPYGVTGTWARVSKNQSLWFVARLTRFTRSYASLVSSCNRSRRYLALVLTFPDYTDLYHFNFENEPIPDDQPREPIATQEAIRFITLNLRVRRIEAPGPADGQALPVVHFTGTSRSMHASWDPNANSKIRGMSWSF